MTAPPTKVCMFGASPDTGNLGVSALWHATCAGLLARIPDLDLTVFDMNRGERQDRIRVGDRWIDYRRIGANHSRRYYRADSLANMRVAGLLDLPWNRGLRAIREADAVVDVSGGDSFTDLYGARRFRAITLHKRIALRAGARLVLLPQTYGPFEKSANRALAATIVRSAETAWARDQRSFTVLKELLGAHFDPDKHRSGVDLAFGLARQAPVEPIGGIVGRWLSAPDPVRHPLVGINVSGLLYGKRGEAAQRYSFRADYDAVLQELIARILRESPARIVLIPHVYGAPESDVAACEALAGQLAEHAEGRLAALPGSYDQCEIKWIISRFDWFCGTRMHATIAGLSTGVPTSAIAYSPKTAGVFESCGQGDQVADPRVTDTSAVTEALWQSFLRRDRIRETLADALPAVLAGASAQMDAIASICSPGFAVPS